MLTRIISTVMTVVLLTAVPETASTSNGFDLLTPGEIALRRDRPLTREIEALASEGPEILIHAPQGFDLASPVDFDVEIVARDGSEPNMDTLKIEYRIGPIWTDVTDRLRTNAELNGTRMLAPGARLPEGRHTLRLTIADEEGRVTSARLSFTVGS